MKISGYFTRSLKKDQNDHFIYKDYSDHSYIIIDFNNQKR